MDPAAFVPLGRIVKSHGLAGEVSVAAEDGVRLDRAIDVRVWLVPPPHGVREGVIEGVRPGPKGPLVRLSGITSLGQASALRGIFLMADPQTLPDGVCDFVEIDDPIGLLVTDAERGELGEVVEVIVTGANDVWVVSGSSYGQVLLPVIPQCVTGIDWEARTADVTLLPGLIEED
jgi:16S rRNA processing protein RimM